MIDPLRDYRVATFSSGDWQTICKALVIASAITETDEERRDYEALVTDIQTFIVKQPEL